MTTAIPDLDDNGQRLALLLMHHPVATLRALAMIGREAIAAEARSPVRSWLKARGLDAADALEALVATGAVTLADIAKATAPVRKDVLAAAEKLAAIDK